jgi:hypothetical protein
MVIFHGYVSHNQMVCVLNDAKKMATYIFAYFCPNFQQHFELRTSIDAGSSMISVLKPAAGA